MRLEAPFETGKGLLLFTVRFAAIDEADHAIAPAVRSVLRLTRAPSQRLQEHELCHDVAIARWNDVVDAAAFLEPARDSIHGVVGKIIGGRAVSTPEVLDEPAANLDVTLALRVPSLIEPRQEPVKCPFVWLAWLWIDTRHVPIIGA